VRRAFLRVAIVGTPVRGHINPFLAIGKLLTANGHSVTVHLPHAFEIQAEANGMSFVPVHESIDRDLTDMATAFPELLRFTPGAEMMRFYYEKVFIDMMKIQDDGLRALIQSAKPDLILYDCTYLGAMPLLAQPRVTRPAVVACGISSLHTTRTDGAPFGPGLPPASTQAERERYAAIAAEVTRSFSEPVQEHFVSAMRDLGAALPTMSLLDMMVCSPDLYLQPTIPSFEYAVFPARDQVRFVGALPVPPSGELPDWANDIGNCGKRAVLVSQGTLANHDLTQLVRPTLDALADRDDVLVLVTTGGRPTESVKGDLPGNVRVAEFLPFDRLMPSLDLIVTNGGYGTVNHALSCGVPLVVAGLSEDKAEVNMRVGWSGAGINLATQTPSAAAIRDAVDTVLDVPAHRNRAQELGREFAAYQPAIEIPQLLESIAAPS
jgi:MGT family glycosyltransferase